jgi:hypothetical protein
MVEPEQFFDRNVGFGFQQIEFVVLVIVLLFGDRGFVIVRVLK